MIIKGNYFDKFDLLYRTKTVFSNLSFIWPEMMDAK